VVVDVSQSIRGFTADGSINLEKLHTAIDNALGDAEVATPLQRCTLGDELSCSVPLTRPQFNNEALYSAGNCRLDRAIRVPPVVDPRNPPRDELDHHRVTIVLTDGMQSSAGGGGAGNDPVAACNSGADPNCVRLLLRHRIQQGYGVWLTQIMLPFEGTHYAEQGLDRNTYDGIRAHVADAALRLPYSRNAFPAPEGRHHGSRRREPAATLSIGRDFRVDGRNGLASYDYRGWKPILAWIITCDRALGDRLSELLSARLAAQGLIEPNDRRFFSVRVAPMAGQPRQFGPMVRGAVVAGQVDVGRPTRTPTGVVQRVICNTEGRAELTFPIVAGRVQYANPPFVRESMGLTFEGRTLSRDALSSPVAGPGGLVRTLRCERFPAGVHRETMVLGSSLSLGEIPADAWWREFNAINSYAMPERVFGLQPLAEGLLEAGAHRAFRWDSFTIEIERQ